MKLVKILSVILFYLVFITLSYAVKWPQTWQGKIVRVEAALYPQCVFLKQGEKEEIYLEATKGIDCQQLVGKPVQLSVKHAKIKEQGVYGTRDTLLIIKVIQPK